MRPRGTFCIHLPIHNFPTVNRRFSAFAARLYGMFSRAADVKAELARLRMRRGGTPYMHGISLEQSWLFETLDRIGFVDPVIATIRTRSNKGAHSCILATR